MKTLLLLILSALPVSASTINYSLLPENGHTGVTIFRYGDSDQSQLAGSFQASYDTDTQIFQTSGNLTETIETTNGMPKELDPPLFIDTLNNQVSLFDSNNNLMVQDSPAQFHITFYKPDYLGAHLYFALSAILNDVPLLIRGDWYCEASPARALAVHNPEPATLLLSLLGLPLMRKFNPSTTT